MKQSYRTVIKRAVFYHGLTVLIVEDRDSLHIEKLSNELVSSHVEDC